MLKYIPDLITPKKAKKINYQNIDWKFYFKLWFGLFGVGELKVGPGKFENNSKNSKEPSFI
jgi:hypothetical protein